MDHESSVRSKKDGGCVMIAVNSCISAIRCCDFETNIEILWIEIQLDKCRRAFIETAYMSPDSKLSAV